LHKIEQEKLEAEVQIAQIINKFEKRNSVIIQSISFQNIPPKFKNDCPAALDNHDVPRLWSQQVHIEVKNPL